MNRNLITDVEGILVGNAQDARLKSGVTAIVCAAPAIGAVHVMGGSPGTRETDLLSAENSVEHVDAVVLSGGSAFGLDAASGVQAWLRGKGRGFRVGPHSIPIVPAAILFDLANGGDKQWERFPPYRDLGHDAAEAARESFSLGSVGAGTGAATAGLKGGLGSASAVLPGGAAIGAIAAVNAIGSATIGDSGRFWAAPFEVGEEFGGLGHPSPFPPDAAKVKLKWRDREMANTTIAVVATDAALTRAELKRVAISAHDGLARAIWPSHTPADGDLVFCLSTGRKPRPADANAFVDLCALAASTLSRAVARGVYLATPAPGDIFPTWRERHGAS